MTDTTKPNLSREAVERLADDLYAEFLRRPAYEDDGCSISYAADTLRALLDAKEAAERECEMLDQADTALNIQLTEARASAAAAYGEGYRDCAYGERNRHHSATEALRRVKEAVWDEVRDEAAKVAQAYKSEHYRVAALIKNGIRDLPNPYTAKETAHG